MSLKDLFPQLSLMQDALLGWFARARRPLPWRETYDPYSVWISEIMLQQTQMTRGIAFYQNWMRRFPDLAALAKADEKDVFKAWEGLGYYSRAKNILKTARLAAQNGGTLPDSVDALLKLPGIGPYTAKAIASIAYNLPAACVDANVERVLSRLCDLETPVRTALGKKELAALAQDFLTPSHAREHNEAMMELGALVCGKSPKCPECPLKAWCLALRRGTVKDRPILPERQQRIPLNLACGIIPLLDEGQCKILVQRRPAKDVWGNLWTFPYTQFDDSTDPAAAIAAHLAESTGIEAAVLSALPALKTSYTKYRVAIAGFVLKPAATFTMESGASALPHPLEKDGGAFAWAACRELNALPMPAPFRRMSRLILQRNVVLNDVLNDAARAGS